MLGALKTGIVKLPKVGDFILNRYRLRAELAALKKQPHYAPSGHFYSPVPSLEEVRKAETRIFGPAPRSLPGLDLHESEQLELLERFVPYYEQIPFQSQKAGGLRYHFENPSYSYSDAVFLYCMIRHLKPKRIIEVGSGHSSCVTLDTNELFFGGSINVTFVEPYPELLLSLVKGADKKTMRVIPSRLQDVDAGEFAALRANDILFIDSTHVGKIDSDVNRIFFDVMPSLAPGVHIHFHDIFYPFEYPREWIYEGRAWNEAYLLRAFLEYNSAFRVVAFNTFLEHFHEPFFREKMPLCLKNRGGSIWIRKQ